MRILKYSIALKYTIHSNSNLRNIIYYHYYLYSFEKFTLKTIHWQPFLTFNDFTKHQFVDFFEVKEEKVSALVQLMTN